jgi:HAMP domain-containing protein
MEGSEVDARITYLSGRIAELVKQYETGIADILIRHQGEVSRLNDEIARLRQQLQSQDLTQEAGL